MSKLKLHIFSILILCFFSIQTQAFNPKITFTSKDTRDGLFDNWVRCIHQDTRGFIWVGTSSGLHRYDGVNFKFYPFQYKNVNAIVQKDDMHLWVCTDGGVYIFNTFNEIFTEFTPVFGQPTLSIAKDKDGFVWFGTNQGLASFNTKDSSLVWYYNDPQNSKSVSNNYINTLFVDRDNILWIGTKHGFNRFNSLTKTFSRFDTDNADLNLLGNDISSIVQDSQKRLFVGTMRGGITVYTDKNDLHNKAKSFHIMQGDITTMLIDSENLLYVGESTGGGLHVIDLNALEYFKIPKIYTYTKNGYDPNSLSDNSIFCSYQDSYGDLWFGTYTGGINFYSKYLNQFTIVQEYEGTTKILSNSLVYNFLKDSVFLWMGTEAGLDCWNKKTNTFTSYINNPVDSKSIKGGAVFQTFKDSQGNLWIGTWGGGVNKFDYKTKTFSSIIIDTTLIVNTYAIDEDLRGNLWIGTNAINGGLYSYNIQTAKVTKYAHNPKDSTSISHNMVNDIMVAKSGTVYVSTYLGLNAYNIEHDNFTYAPLVAPKGNNSTPYVSCVLETSKYEILVGTNFGIYKLDSSLNKLVPDIRYSKYGTTIQSIIEDDYGTIWAGTRSGLIRFVSNTSKDSIYDVELFSYLDGMSANECITRSLYKDPQGYIYVGTSKSVSYIHQDSVLINNASYPIVITDVLLRNVSENNAQYTSIQNKNFTNDTIELSYANSDFTINYAVLNFRISQKNNYAYKLVGYDSEWIQAGKQTSVTYTNIQPGKYVFMVKAANNDGKWNTSPLALTIIIHPPWWKTIYFYIGLVLAFLGLIWAVFQVRISMYKKQKEVLSQKVEERTTELSSINKVLQKTKEEISSQNDELFKHRNQLQLLIEERTADLLVAKQKAEESDKLKSAFLSNMSHEIRTPMNGIVGFAELLMNEDISDDERREHLRVITESSKQLLRIVGDIIDISRIETGTVSILKEPTSLICILKDIAAFFELQAEQKGIHLHLQLPETDVVFETDKTRLTQILTNLISNSLKFTQTGSISFGAELLNNTLHFFVKDTGIGVPKELQVKIFERFRQAEMHISRNFGGTGLGLAISKELIELLGGTINLESEVGVGSTFSFTHPYTAADLNKNKIVHEELAIQNSETITVLIAEDNTINYNLINTLLTRANIKTIRALNGQEAVDICKHTEHISIVLMDIQMPVLDGIEAMKQIQAFRPQLPIVVQTSFVTTDEKRLALEAGCVGFLSKPIRKLELLQTIETYTSR